MSDCLSKVKAYVKEAGLELSGKSLAEIARLMETQRAGSFSKAEFAAKVQDLIDTKLADFYAKKQATEAIYLADRESTVQTIESNQFGTGQAENFRAWVDGSSLKNGDTVNMDPRKMAATTRSRLSSIWARGIESIQKVVESGSVDRQFFQELAAIQNGTEVGGSNSKEAVQAAKSANAVLSQIFDRKKSHLLTLEPVNDYLIKRFHDRTKIMDAGLQAWLPKALQAFGEKSFPDLNPGEKIQAFTDIYRRIESGTYGSVSDDLSAQSYRSVPGIGGDILRRFARERTLVASTPDHAYQYNAEFGYGNVSETMNRVISQASKDLARLDKFGPQPERMYQETYQRVKDRASETERQKMEVMKPTYDQAFRTAMGLTDAPSKNIGAKIVENTLSFEYLVHGGIGMLRGFPDLSIAAGKIADVTGKNVAEHALDLVTEWGKAFSSTEARNEGLQHLGLFAHTTGGNLLSELGGINGVSGWMSKFADSYGSVTGIHRWVDSMRFSTARVIAKAFGKVADSAWKDLGETYKNTLTRYGLKEPEWNLLRQSMEMDPNGSKLFTPEGVEQIPSEKIKALVGGDAPEEAVDLARYRLSQAVGVLLNDHADYGSMTANTRQRAFMTQGASVNEPLGMALRLFGQFKNAALISADAYRRTAASAGGLQSAWFNLAQTSAMGMFLWSIGEYAYQAIQGKTPEDPRSPRFLIRMVTGSGGAGIAADIFLNAAAKNGVGEIAKGALEGFAGPTAVAGAQAFGIAAQSAKHAYDPLAPATGKDAGQFLTSQLPLQNLAWTKGLYNFYFANGLREFMGPGYLSNLQMRASQTPGLMEPHQRYFMLKPTESPQWQRSLLR